MLDLAHASEQTWRDVLAEEVPFSVTHACCRTVHDHRRNLADWQLEGLAERGGVLGLMAVRFAVDPDAPTVSRLVDHVDHAVSVMGIEHVGIGADFIKLEAAEEESMWIDGFAGPAEYPALVAGLQDRGYGGNRLDAILSGNWLRVLRETLSRGEPHVR
jgi:membrane dipeptidase